jgi:hypothetical protein
MHGRVKHAVIALLGLAACEGGKRPPADAQEAVVIADATRADSSIDKISSCVDDFGDELVEGFFRIDGEVVAVLPPFAACPRSNDDHLIVQIRTGTGVYRVVAATESKVGVPTMALHERAAALVGPPWAPGVHAGVPFDFVTTFDLHRLDFTPTPPQAMVDTLYDAIDVGSHISVFATVENSRDSAHLVHRNQRDRDGAIIVNADSAPRYFLLRFDNQLF